MFCSPCSCCMLKSKHGVWCRPNFSVTQWTLEGIFNLSLFAKNRDFMRHSKRTIFILKARKHASATRILRWPVNFHSARNRTKTEQMVVLSLVHLCDKHNTSEISISTTKRYMFLFSCAYAYAYLTCVMLIIQVWTRLKIPNKSITGDASKPFFHKRLYSRSKV